MNSTHTVYSAEDRFLCRIREKYNTYSGGSITCKKNDETGIAEICIRNTAKRNAISGNMMVDLEYIVDELEKWTFGKGIIIHGEGNMFCSGGDLDFAMKESNPDCGYDMTAYMTRILNKLSALPLVSVAYINGHGALGGGAELSTATDFRLMSNENKTRIGFVHNVMGITPAWGGFARLTQIIGKQKALNLILTAKILTADEAVQIGLADGIVSSFETAMQWLIDRVKHDVTVVRATKMCITNACKIHDDVIMNEECIFAPLWGAPPNKAALMERKKHM